MKVVFGRSGWFLGVLCPIFATAVGSDWPQWRGPDRSGAANTTVRLRDRLPAEGMLPEWQIKIPGGGNGGWGSPVVAEGLVLLATHVREKKPETELPDVQFPPLTDQQKTTLSQEEQEAYEQKRQEEQRQRRETGFTARDILYCFDAMTGETRWKSDSESMPTRFPQSGTPAVHDGRVFHLTANRVLRCVDLADARELWSTRLPGPITDDDQTPSSVVIVQGLAVVFAGPLSAVDITSGEIRWQNGELTNRQSSPALWQDDDGSLLVVNTADRNTHLVSPENGASLWSVGSGASRSSPVVVEDLLITAGESRKNGISAWKLSKSGAEALWTYHGVADPGATPAVSEGRVFAVGDKRICGLDAATGEAIFESKIDVAQPRYTSPIAVGGRVLYTHGGLFMFAGDGHGDPLISALIGEDGRIASEDWFREQLATESSDPKAEAATWEKLVSQHGPLDCTSPAFAAGHLYVRLKTGLACYDLQD